MKFSVSFERKKNRESADRAEPFLKWAGGKGQLLRQYESFFPLKFNNYLEPFVGGGAVFFHFHNTRRLDGNKRVILIDDNKELMNCYSVIKENVEKLIGILSSPKYINNKNAYYAIRKKEPQDRFERAAKTIYLNKTCYNGLYRVNSQGKFNVPFGRYKNPLICDSKNLKVVSLALRNVEISPGDFQTCLEFAKKSDFVYFDPPYQPLSKTSSFTSYTKDSFSEEEQHKLCEVFKKLDKRGCKLMLSNSNTNFIRTLYKYYRVETVYAKRAISCRPSGRGAITEIVILNY